jgi:hypothetical protein
MKTLRKNIHLIYQHICANNDKNGNPNRIYHIYNSRLEYLGWIDEGYSGSNFTHGHVTKEMNTIYVTGTRNYKIGQEYRNASGN